MFNLFVVDTVEDVVAAGAAVGDDIILGKDPPNSGLCLNLG